MLILSVIVIWSIIVYLIIRFLSITKQNDCEEEIEEANKYVELNKKIKTVSAQTDGNAFIKMNKM